MSSEQRKMLDVSVAPQKVYQFREFLQSNYDNCEAKAYVEHIAQDRDGKSPRLVSGKHLSRTLSRNEPRNPFPLHLKS
ncbi:unnamed protein product [Rotaria socialis]|nr:unnamed protein product [Rotaria socialis]